MSYQDGFRAINEHLPPLKNIERKIYFSEALNTQTTVVIVRLSPLAAIPTYFSPFDAKIPKFFWT